MTNEKKPRGFAAISRDRVREIASMGGKAAHANGTAHKFSKEEASVAGRKGGMAPRKSRKVVESGQSGCEEAAPVNAADER